MNRSKTAKVRQESKFIIKTKLYTGILLDIIGMIPTGFPPLALLWAPLSGMILATMYKGRVGKVAGIFDFAEELIPGINFIPTFTITWFYVYGLKGLEK